MTQQEDDFPPGHPKRFDYDPDSPEAKKWMKMHYFPKGERDYPPGHPKAVDTEGNTNAVEVRAGIDPNHPELEEFSGRTPAQAKRAKEITLALSQQAKETVPPKPGIAPEPPPPGSSAFPTGQPSLVHELLHNRRT